MRKLISANVYIENVNQPSGVPPMEVQSRTHRTQSIREDVEGRYTSRVIPLW